VIKVLKFKQTSANKSSQLKKTKISNVKGYYCCSQASRVPHLTQYGKIRMRRLVLWA